MGKKSKDKGKKEIKGPTDGQDRQSASGSRTKTSNRSGLPGDSDSRSGSSTNFGWAKHTAFPELPPYAASLDAVTAGHLIYSERPWSEYIICRGIQDLAQDTIAQDGLSCVFTIARVYLQLCAEGCFSKEGDATNSVANIVLVGASADCEERLLRAGYWEELGFLLPGRRIRLWLTGEDLSGTYIKHSVKVDCMEVHSWKGKASDFFLRSGRMAVMKGEDTFVVGLNLTFAREVGRWKTLNTGNALENSQVWNWLPEIYFLAISGFPVMFTSPTYTDATGQQTLLDVVGCIMVFENTRNISPYTPTLRDGDQHDPPQGNMWWLVFEGQDVKRAAVVDSRNKEHRLKDLLAAMDRNLTWEEGPASLQPPLSRLGGYPEDTAAAAAYVAAAAKIKKRALEDDDNDEEDASQEPKLNVTMDTSSSDGLVVVVVNGLDITAIDRLRLGICETSFKLCYFGIRHFQDVMYQQKFPCKVKPSSNPVFKRSSGRLVFTVSIIEYSARPTIGSTPS